MYNVVYTDDRILQDFDRPSRSKQPGITYLCTGIQSTLVECLSAGLQRHRDLTFPSAMDNGVAKSGEYSDHY